MAEGHGPDGSARMSLRRPGRRWLTWAVPPYVVLLVLYLFANSFSGHTSGLHLPIGPDRILIVLMLIALLTSVHVRWSRVRIGATATLAALTVVYAAASAYLHGTATTSLGLFALLDRLVIPYLLFVLAPVLLPDDRSRELLLKFLVVFGIYLGLTAIFELIGPHALVFPRYIMDPNVGIGFGRARGPFVSSDQDASVMSATLFASIAVATSKPSRLWLRLSLLSAAVSLIGVFLSLTRASWIAAVAGLVVCSLSEPRVRRWLLRGVLVAVAGAVLAVAVSPALYSQVVDRTTTSRSVYDRESTDSAAIRAIREYPLFGIGWLTFVNTSDRYVRQASTFPLTETDIEVHNVPLGRVAELGVLGGGLWIATVFAGPIRAMFVRRRRDDGHPDFGLAFLGFAVSWLIAIQFSPFPYPLPNALIWLMAGAVLAPTRATPAEPDASGVAGVPGHVPG